MKGAVLVAVIALLGWRAAADETRNPAQKWVSVHAWIQTGERLASSGQWPLALGSYLEARRQVEEVAAAHPGFEPEMVALRRDRLAASIADAEARVTDDEHEVMMRYLDFIESLEAGEAQRYADQYEVAHATLTVAKALLEEIVAVKPEAFRSAVAPQFARLDSSLTWLESQIDFKTRKVPPVRAFHDDSIDWGTTRYLKPEELPVGAGGLPGPSVLFPGVPLEAPAAAKAESDGKAGEARGGPTPPRFRMNSRRSVAPVPAPESR